MYQLAVALVALLLAINAVAGDRNGSPEFPASPPRCTDLEGRPEACPETAVQRPQPSEEGPAGGVAVRRLPSYLFRDQREFWTSPARLRGNDVGWLVPFTLGAAALMSADRGIEGKLPTSTSITSNSKNASDLGAAALIGTAGGLYLWGRAGGDEHRQETGFIAGEALLNSFMVTEAFKFAAGRQRPLEGNGHGDFFKSSSSFPSQHAAAAWSVATVLASEYPGPLTKLLAYGTALGVSAGRVAGRQHFASDVLVGSALGWYFGHQAFRNHAAAADAPSFGTFSKPADAEPRWRPGSAYVPLDSWVYPVLTRLAGSGYVRTGILGLQPWTRSECARLVTEAHDATGTRESEDAQVSAWLVELDAEFADELRADSAPYAEIESLYTRVTGITGKPLNDGFHFAQTIFNDFGRPYAAGANVVSGVSSRAVAGRFVFYARGEYQHAPGERALPLDVQHAIAATDGTAYASVDRPDVNRLRLLDSYVGVQLGGWELSFGKQSLWWGASSAPLLFTDNAEPVLMARATNPTPVKLPSILGLLGPVRTEFFFGRLSGQNFILTENGMFGTPGRTLANQPFIHGQKFSFKPTPNLEFGVSRTTVFGGEGVPVTWHSFARSMFSGSNSNLISQDPGDRRSGFDFSYRLPKLRNWLTLYNDSFTEDDISPLNVPRRSAMNPGLYLSHVPFVPKLDVRAEGVYTALPGFHGGADYYINFHYRDGYRNAGNLLANWAGREGRGMQFTSTYSFSAKNLLRFSYRKLGVDPEFLRGGTLHDLSAAAQYMVRPDLMVSGGMQYEKWRFPLLSASPQSDVSASVQFQYWPQWRIH